MRIILTLLLLSSLAAIGAESYPTGGTGSGDVTTAQLQSATNINRLAENGVITNLGSATFTSATFTNASFPNGATFSSTSSITAGTRLFLHDSVHTVITNTATLTSSEWTSGSQKEWYNGSATMTLDKTNGNTTVYSLNFSTSTITTGNGTAIMDMTKTNEMCLLATNANITLTLANLPASTAASRVLILTNTGANASTFLLTVSGFSMMTNGWPTYTTYVTNLTAKNQVYIMSILAYGPNLVKAVGQNSFDP